MKKTKVVNETRSSITLKEGTGGVYRTLCSELKPNNAFTIKVDTNATYREYWCAVTSEDEKHVVLSSDDCLEYEEVRIKLKEDESYTWDGVKRGSHELVPNAPQASKQPPAKDSSSTSDPGLGFVGKAWNKIKGVFS